MALNISFIAAAFVLACALTYVVIVFCNKKGIYDEVDGRKVHTGNIPRLGGIALFSVFFILAVIYTILNRQQADKNLLYILAGGILIFITGVLDDLYNFRAKVKFVLQIISALCVAISPYNFTHIMSWQLPVILGKVITFGWLLFGMNAYNLIDGLDWLCSGLSLLALIPMAVITWANHSLVSILICILCAAIAGFMVWNKPTAKTFLGDGGSQTLGFFVTVVPLLYMQDVFFNYTKLFYGLLLTSIPFIDVIAAIIRRTRDHRRIFSPDRAHIHHKLLNIGASKIGALSIIFAFQFFIDFIAVLAYQLSLSRETFKLVYIVLLSAYALIIVAFCVLHYVNRHFNKLGKGHLDSAPQEEH